MSKIGEQLQRLHKPSGPIGFGFARTAPARPRMLILVTIDGSLPEATAGAMAECADAIASDPEAVALREALARLQSAKPLGVRVQPAAKAEDIEGHACDFVMCDFDSPSELVSLKDKGTLLHLMADLEPMRLRAIGELGVEAVILPGTGLDLKRLAAVIECRRVRSACGRPVLLQIDHVIEPAIMVALWHAGVDGLMVDSALGLDNLKALREAVDGAPFEARPTNGGTVAIGTRLGGGPAAEAEEGGDDDDDEEDDE